MITITGRVLEIPDEEKNIGVEGDNDVETRQFLINDPNFINYDYKMDVCNEQGLKNVIDLDKTIDGDNVTLTWLIKKEQITAGLLTIEIRAFNDAGQVWQSYQYEAFFVSEAINATDYFPSVLPSEFLQMEQRVTDAKNNTLNAANTVSQNAGTVATNMQTTIDKAAEALQSAAAALLSEQNAKQSEDAAKNSETNAYDSMQKAVQAMTDLLAMLGTDIATLTGGKLTPSQIPAIAITDTFVVNSESEMLALDAQTGDVCIRTDESKTYILQGNDPSVLENWKQMQTPTNYADNAGHANTADEAVNATMINNHRQVRMTQEDFNTAYDSGTLDPDTDYWVAG